ncbi:MAG TPA: hypothetical protein VGG63_12250 [Steroidobacteraceae bacterium]
MITVGRAGWLTATLMTVSLAGCATTPHGGLDHSADRLDHNAQAFAEDAQGAPRGYDENTDYTEDARDFADRAHEFRRAVEDPGADKHDVRASFDDLSRSYHTLRDDVQHSDSDAARHDLQPVTAAYLDVEDDMGGAAPSRYSEADYDH